MAIVALAGMVRCQHLGALSYNFDEAFCVKMIGIPVGDISGRCARDNHPPLYFYLLWAWSHVLGNSPAALRSLGVALGLATVVGAYLLVRQIVGTVILREAAALAAAALVAFSPMQVDWSQHARMGYALGAALSVVSSWLLLRALQAAMPRRRDLVFYALAAAALAYTHHFALFVLIGQLLYAVGWAMQEGEAKAGAPHAHARSIARPSFIGHRRRSLIAFTLVAAAYLPWLPNLLRQREQVSRSFHTSAFTWREVAKACYQTLAVRWEDEPPGEAAAWAALAGCGLAPLAMLLWGRGGLRLVGLCVLTTFEGAICASVADRNIIQSRYFVFANALLLCGVPALVSQMAVAAKDARGVARKRAAPLRAPPLRVGLLAATLTTSVAGMAWLCLEHAARREVFARRPGMAAAVAYLADARRPDEPVLVCNPLLQITADAYAPSQPPPVRVLSGDRVFPHFQGMAVMLVDEFLSPAALEASGASTIWAIDAVDWISPEWKLNLPREWIEVSEATFPEWAAAENCLIVVRQYVKQIKEKG